jgi:agmatine deiminase
LLRAGPGIPDILPPHSDVSSRSPTRQTGFLGYDPRNDEHEEPGMTVRTPWAAGYRMPAEWEHHEACLMEWPTRTDLWGDRLAAARDDYARVARAIAAHEPVVMICPPGHGRAVTDQCGTEIEPLELPLDDSWVRDNGPIFVRNEQGEPAVVNFEFNAWGQRWQPYDSDNAIPAAVASHFGLPRFDAPLILEGGSFFVDGQGTLVTTEQCLLNPNRNPRLNRSQIEELLREYLGVTTIIWLPFGHSADVGPEGTDGHVDGVLQYVGPGRVLLEMTSVPDHLDHERGLANLAVLSATTDALGRALDITLLDPGADSELSYSNFYLANNAVIVPVMGDERDDGPLHTLRTTFPEREVVGVPGQTIAFGGGGPHCITQQIPSAGQ